MNSSLDLESNMDLILVRHAIAFDHDPMRWPDDSERPLTPAGERRFERAAAGLRQIVDSVDTVLTSRYVRAIQTAAILEEFAGWPTALPFPELEPPHDATAVVVALQRRQDQGVVALVGHEALLGELAGMLMAGPDAPAQPLKKGGAACFQSQTGVQTGGMMLRWWLPPKIARRLRQA